MSPFRSFAAATLVAVASTVGPPSLLGSTAPVVPATAAAAHELGQSYIFLRVYSDSLIVRYEITTEDVERALGLGWDAEAGVTEAQVQAALDSIRSYVEAHSDVRVPDAPGALVFRQAEVRFLEVADFVMLTYALEGLEEIPDSIAIRYDVLFEVDRQHRNFGIIEHNWKTGTFNSEAIALVFSPGNADQVLDLTSSSVWRGFVAMVWQGVWHIWIGIDHILFLIALVLPAVLVRKDDGERVPAESFKQALWNIVAIVTFFTLAHSITLSVAAFGLVDLPPAFVETIIALSIAVAAFANLLPRLKIREWTIAFIFGLFHGFGFAYVLGDIGLGREHLVLTLLGFNVGVELGQIAIIALAFPVLFLLRKTRLYRWILVLGSIGLIAVALLWAAERSLGFNVPLGPIIRSLVPFL